MRMAPLGFSAACWTAWLRWSTNDAAGIYIVDCCGKRLRHTMVRGCDLPIPKLEAPFAGKGIVGDVLASGQPAAASSDSSDEASVGRPCAKSRLVVPIVGSGATILGALDVWSDQPGGTTKTRVI